MTNWGPKVPRREVIKSEETQYHPLEALVLSLSKTKNLTETAKRGLADEVRFIATGGEIIVMPSPKQLYDQDEVFKEYCKNEVVKHITVFNQRLNQTNIIRHIRGYNWNSIGYLEFQKSNSKPEEKIVKEINIEVK